MAGVEQHLAGVKRLVVLPNPQMLGLPAQLLADSAGVFLGDRYAVSYAPSATVYAWMRENAGGRRPAASWRALLVGNPVSGMAGPSARNAHLPRADEELRTIAAAFPGADLLEGPRASEPALAELVASGALRDYQLIHFSTHALIDAEHPAESGLVLSPAGSPDPAAAPRGAGRLYDNRLSAREVAREWHLGAELVTLAGCSTALGQDVGGEGFVGLTDAFLRAGARTLLMSMWDVDDEASALLLTRFYQNLAGAYAEVRAGRRGEPMPKAEALQEAEHWLRTYRDASGRRPFAHPAYWAGFILVGDPD
jgi:CHAT domain-containing protein